ncbi:MAG TPA: NADH-quinone oxidoreductase subunit J [Tepidisphaeraceae bacterium]|nr:NADH-quinone oxidoreductase subunit J [Tepidisphaeraceae bacterium]
MSILAEGATPLAPAAILALCVVAGVGTVLLLPSRREASLAWIGGVVLGAAGLILAAMLAHFAAAAQGVGVYFWIFAAIALVGAVRVVTHPKPVYSALYFVLTVFASAGLFLLLKAEFMAAALVLIYAGAILVTYVFVIMLASEAASQRAFVEYDMTSRDPLLASAIGFAMMGVMLFAIFDHFQPIARPSGAGSAAAAFGTTQQLGEYLFTHQIVNLELAGLILTIAMVGAIVIARRKVWTGEPEPAGGDEVVLGLATPVNDNPHSVPVQGTSNPSQKAFPET